MRLSGPYGESWVMSGPSEPDGEGLVVMRRIGALWTSGLVTAVLAATAPGALAGDAPVTRVVLRDGPGDVWVAGDGEEGYTPAGSVPTADVTRAVAAHRTGSVVVHMRFVDLRRVDSQNFGAFIYAGRRTIVAMVSASPGARAGRHQLIDYRAGRVRCPGFTHDIDYATETVVMRVPRSCLGRPAWVRLSLLNGVYRDGGGGFRELTDNPHNRRSTTGTTVRLHRG